MSDNPAILFFETAWAAFRAHDVQALEDLTRGSTFPRGSDGWLGRH